MKHRVSYFSFLNLSDFSQHKFLSQAIYSHTLLMASLCKCLFFSRFVFFWFCSMSHDRYVINKPTALFTNTHTHTIGIYTDFIIGSWQGNVRLIRFTDSEVCVRVCVRTLRGVLAKLCFLFLQCQCVLLILLTFHQLFSISSIQTLIYYVHTCSLTHTLLFNQTLRVVCDQLDDK